MGSQQQQQFCLRWSNHQSNMLSVFDDLLRHEALVDVTIACDGVSMKAHKVVLSACSPFFQHLFLENPCQHPIVILKDTKYAELKALVDFMYKGEVNVTQEQLATLLKTAETLKIKGLAEVTGGMNGQQQQHENDGNADGGGGGDRGDGLLTPPPPLERPQHFQQRSTVDGRTSATSTPPPPPSLPPPPPPPQTAHLPPPLQLPSAIVSPPQSQSLRLVSKGIAAAAAAAAASSLSITIPTSSVSTVSDSHNVSSRSPSSPPSKRKKTRHRRRSSDGGGGGGNTLTSAEDCRIEMQGSPELIEAKVEVTSPDEEFEESQITRRPHRTRRLLTAIASAAAAARSASMEPEHEHEQEHDHDHDEDERMTTRTSLPDPQTDSNQESMDNLYTGQGPSSAPPSGEEYNLSIGGDPMSGAAGGGHLLMKIKSPIPSTSSQGDPLAGGIVQRHEYGGSGSGGDRGTTSGGSGYIPKRGQPRILNEAEEINIVTYIVDMAAKGRPVTRRCVLEYGNTLLRRQDRIPTGSIHCNPEKGLSNDWWKEFKKRHPGLPVRAPTSSQPLASSSTQLLASTSLGDGGGGGGADWSRMVDDSESDCPKDQ